MFTRITFAGVIALALTVTVVSTGAALAGKGAGHNSATITFATSSAGFSASTDTTSWPSMGSSVNFAVTANVRDRDLYKLWVANRCSQGGVPIYQEYQPVHDGLTDTFTLNWTEGGAECTAYVWLFPDPETPLPGGSMTYVAGP